MAYGMLNSLSQIDKTTCFIPSMDVDHDYDIHKHFRRLHID